MKQLDCMTVDSGVIPLSLNPEEKCLPLGEFLPAQPEGMESLLGSLKMDDLFTPNFSLRACQGTVPHDVVFYHRRADEVGLLGSCIFFKGTVHTHMPGRQGTFSSFNRSQNFKFDPQNELRHYAQADTDLSFLHISYRPCLLEQVLPEDQKWADQLKHKVERNERVVGEQFVAISLAQEQALSNIFNAPFTGKLGYMMIETSIMQVLLFQLYFLFHKEEAFKPACVGRRDLETMNEVRDYLDRNFLDDHSISSLAQTFGTNTNKLMNLFKKVFGKSIFEYITCLRMEHARRLLTEEGLRVTEVSRSVGYKNPNHFSVAFKKKFGVNPSVYR